MRFVYRSGRWKPSPSAAVLVSVALGLAGNLAVGTVQVTWQWWPLTAWTAVVLLCAGSVIIERARAAADSAGQADGTLEYAAEVLAGEVEQQWDREAGLRQLYMPVPLQVRWSSTGRPVAASRDVVLGQDADSDWQQLPLMGNADEIVTALRRLPYRQLVILGEAGAGKSVLAMLLTLRLLKAPEPGEPVPVLLPVTSWNPAQEPVEDFLARRIAEDYPPLTLHGEGGQAMARLLVARRRILPILDGLDELPGGMHPQAVQALDTYAAPDRPLVVTCRSREYEQAVRNSGSVLSRSAVVEIEPVTTEQAIAFLSHPAPARLRWQPVLERLHDHPESRLARSLSTPLMVALARGAYRGRDRNPADLLVLTDDADIASALMDGFVTSMYQDVPTGRRGFRLRLSRGYNADEAVRWLSCLAYHLYLAGTRDLWWWQLRPRFMSPRPGRFRRGIPVGYTLAAATCGFAIGQERGLWPAVWDAVTAAIIVAASAAGLFRPMWPASFPPYVPRRLRPHGRSDIQRIGIRTAFGAVFGLAAGLAAGSPVLGLAGSVAGGLMAVLIPNVPVRKARWRSGPFMTMRLNRRNVVNAAIQYGLIGGLTFAVLARFITKQGSALDAGCTAALIYALAAASNAGGWTWIMFRTAHIQLAIHRQLPWRLWTFLEDAHSQGALRQAGTSWQFRHALLQDHLARRTYLEHLRARADAGDLAAAQLLADVLARAGRVDELRTRAEGGDRIAAQRLVEVLTQAGRVDEAIAVLRSRADADDWAATFLLADLLAEASRVDEAMTVLGPLAHAGDLKAADRLAGLLVRAGRVDEAMTILRRRADAGYWSAESRLADLLAEAGRIDELRIRAEGGDRIAAQRLVEVLVQAAQIDEAITVLQPRADAGDRTALYRLADLLAEAGRIDEAITVLGSPAHTGDWNALDRLAGLLVRTDRVDEAIAVLRPRADAGYQAAADRLADVLAEAGRVDEAIAVLRARADAGGRYAADRLADVLAQAGRIDEAITVLQPRADAGDWTALDRLADILAQAGRIDEAIAILQPRADAGYSHAADRLTNILTQAGRIDEAITVLRPRADASHRGAVARLTGLLAQAGRIDELRTRADTDDPGTVSLLADVLVRAGRVDEAIAVLRPRADAGYWYAAERLADVLAQAGRIDEAIAILRPPADIGDWNAADRLAGLLAQAGRIDELRARADAGGRYAADRLAEVLAEAGRMDEAIAVLRPRADAGDWEAACRLADVLAQAGRVDEAIAVLRPPADAGDPDAGSRLAHLLTRTTQVD